MTVINYENKLAQEAAASEKRERDRVNAEGYAQILNRWPVHDTEANFSVIQSWCAPNPITVEAFAALLRDNPQSVDMWSREKIVADIVAHSHGDQNVLRNLAFKLTTFSLKQLRDARRAIDFKAQVRTKEDAKDYLASQKAENGWRNTGYPRLQPTIVPRGEVRAVPTGQYLRDLARTNLYEFKRMRELYSAAQLDYWLAQ